jgi:hypothetical protein
MANAAAKKAAKAGDSTSSKYLPFVMCSTLLYVGVRFLYTGASISDIVYLMIFSALYAVFYFGLVSNAQNKVNSEMYFDGFVVVFSSEVLSAFTNWGRGLLLLIPGYLIYLGCLWYFSMKKSVPSAPVEDETEDKKTEKIKKPKIKYAR